jgi:hypothetical protein
MAAADRDVALQKALRLAFRNPAGGLLFRYNKKASEIQIETWVGMMS